MIARLLIHFPLAESLHDSCRGTEVVMTLAERRLLTVQSSQQKEGRIFYEDIQGFRPAPGHRRHGYGTIARILMRGPRGTALHSGRRPAAAMLNALRGGRPVRGGGRSRARPGQRAR